MTTHTCLDCDEIISMFAKRCPFHAGEKKHADARKRNERRKLTRKGETRIGEIFQCVNCKRDVVRNNGKQLYCKPCGRIMNNAKTKARRSNGEPPPLDPNRFAPDSAIAANIERLARAAQLPDYNPRCPDKFVKRLQEVMV